MRCMEQPKVQNTEPQLCLIWRRSWALLSARYSWRHCAGAALCVASLGLLVATDVSQPNQAGSQMKPAAGDAIVLAGAALYALSNVAQEKLLRESRLSCPLLLACDHSGMPMRTCRYPAGRRALQYYPLKVSSLNTHALIGTSCIRKEGSSYCSMGRAQIYAESQSA